MPVVIEQPLAGINLLGISLSKVEGAYFTDVSALDQTTGSAKVFGVLKPSGDGDKPVVVTP